MSDLSNDLPFTEAPETPPPPPYDCPNGECKGKCEKYKERVAKGETVTTNSDLHRARNVCNQCPRTPPQPFYINTGEFNPFTGYYESRKVFSGYRDHQGNVWHTDNAVTSWWYHNDPFPGLRDNDNMTFRADSRSPVSGSQCTYRKGRLDDTTGTMGTFDYGPSGTTQHWNMDVTPHDEDIGYIPNLTTQY